LKPLQQELLPQADPATNDQRSAKSFRDPDVMARLFYCSDERGGVPLKLPTG
jgi:hypothetical protein